MLMVLLGAGIAPAVGGPGRAWLRDPVKEFGFGNTLIIAGAVAVCSGFLMIGLWVVARELQTYFATARQRRCCQCAPAFPCRTFACAGTQSAAATAACSRGRLRTSIPALRRHGWKGAATNRRLRRRPKPHRQKPRRNLLFTSTSRKERERAAARASEPLAPDLLSADLRPNPPAMDAPPVEPMMPTAPSPPSFDDAWPKSERGRRTGATPRRMFMPPPPRYAPMRRR